MNSKLLKLTSALTLASMLLAGCTAIGGNKDKGSDSAPADEKTSEKTDAASTDADKKDDAAATTDGTGGTADTGTADAGTADSQAAGDDAAAADQNQGAAADGSGTTAAAGDTSGEAITVDDIWYDPWAYSNNGWAYNVVGNIQTVGTDQNGYPIVHLVNDANNSYIILDNYTPSANGSGQVMGQIEYINGEVYMWVYQ